MTNEQIQKQYNVTEVMRPIGHSATEGHAIIIIKGDDDQRKALVIPPTELEGIMMICQMAWVQNATIAKQKLAQFF